MSNYIMPERQHEKEDFETANECAVGDGAKELGRRGGRKEGEIIMRIRVNLL